jgi:hypothetical protein
VSVVENNDWPASAGAVKELQIARSAGEGTRILLGMAMDRREERFDSSLDTLKERWGKKGARPDDELLPEGAEKWEGTRLPKEARKTLDSKALSSVVGIWKKADPEFSWEDFISTPSDKLKELSSSDNQSQVLKKIKMGGSQWLFVGWSTVEHPRFENGTWGYLQVPTVWLIDSRKTYVQRFQGALSPQINTPDVRSALEATVTSPEAH